MCSLLVRNVCLIWDNRRCAIPNLNFSCTFPPAPRWNVTCSLLLAGRWRFCWFQRRSKLHQLSNHGQFSCLGRHRNLNLSCPFPPAPRWNVTRSSPMAVRRIFLLWGNDCGLNPPDACFQRPAGTLHMLAFLFAGRRCSSRRRGKLQQLHHLRE